ncbi:MAG: GGDEF domain-containing protein [Oscillospiraceae bacterium]|jgi:GGDEF domain-containing protein|nr:GGDEF domain-containing protein [Oscillospiraceae bacterium]
MRQWIDSNLQRDLGIFLFLVCILGIILMVTTAPADVHVPYLLMTCVAFFCSVLAFYGRQSASLILSGTQVIVWATFKLYALYATGAFIAVLDYLWLAVPLLLSASVCLFQYGSAQLERENMLLRTQVEELVLVDALTGLWNLRALYRDLPPQAQFCRRIKAPLALMIVQLRYEQELRALLNRHRFDELRQRMASIISGTLRIGDRVYAIDENGSFGILLSTDLPGGDVVKKRIRSLLESVEAFQGITDANIIVSVRIAFRVCEGEMGSRPVDFKASVEQELQYDV